MGGKSQKERGSFPSPLTPATQAKKPPAVLCFVLHRVERSIHDIDCMHANIFRHNNVLTRGICSSGQSFSCPCEVRINLRGRIVRVYNYYLMPRNFVECIITVVPTKLTIKA